MPLDIVVGTQWGDEGKGHITDLLAAEADYVARFGGGDNAGHTVTIGSNIFQLHLIPSGIIHPGTICIMGNGMVINPSVLIGEIDRLIEQGISVDPDRLKISHNAHLITPAHVALDKALEISKKDNAIGTTQRGIGPAYTDKTARIGLRAGLLTRPGHLNEAIKAHVARKQGDLKTFSDSDSLDANKIAADFAYYAQRLAPYITDTSAQIHTALSEQSSVLAEGAQGTLLDLDHGTYPFVTSSWPTSGGALVGLGVGPKTVRRVVGVAKAYTTRVGEGPFPSEIKGDMAIKLRGTGKNPWDEFGTTTGRPRRVGWLDTVILRYAVQINSLTELAVTKLDILSGLEQIPVCVGYELDGHTISHFPTDVDTLSRCRPIIELLPGWTEDIMDTRRFENLPANARDYVDNVADATGIPVQYVSVGPRRDQVIRMH